jgi:hypothetical protein
LQIIELQLPSFFGNFDARKAAASLPSSTFAFAPPYAFTPQLLPVIRYTQIVYENKEMTLV